MTDIDINAKTDRELLILAIEKLNHVCSKVDRHEKTLFNDGWGIVSQTKILWLLSGAGWSIVLIWLKKVV